MARVGTGPPVVFLHGYPDNLQIWSKLAVRLTDAYEVIALDWPGLGYSDGWSGGTTPFHFADRLATILDELNLERAVVVGMDMGGQPSLVFAANHPDRLSHLVVMNSLVYGEEKTSWEIKLLRRYGWNRWILQRLPYIVFSRAERTFLPQNVKLSKAVRADLWASFRRPEVRLLITRMCAGYEGTLHRLPELYSTIKVPTLVLWAECDKHFPVVQAERLAASLPNATLKVIPQAQHWMPWHNADDVAASLRTFLKSTV